MPRIACENCSEVFHYRREHAARTGQVLCPECGHRHVVEIEDTSDYSDDDTLAQPIDEPDDDFPELSEFAELEAGETSLPALPKQRRKGQARPGKSPEVKRKKSRRKKSKSREDPVWWDSAAQMILPPFVVIVFGYMSYQLYDPVDYQNGSPTGPLGTLIHLMGRRGILIFFGASLFSSLVPALKVLLYRHSDRVRRFVDWQDGLSGFERHLSDTPAALGLALLGLILLSPLFFIDIPDVAPAGRQDLAELNRTLSPEEAAELQALEADRQQAAAIASEEARRNKLEAEKANAAAALETREGARLQHNGMLFAYDANTGRLATLTEQSDSLSIYDTTKFVGQRDFQLVHEVDVVPEPLVVHARRRNGRSEFLVGSSRSSEIQFVDAVTGQTRQTVATYGVCVVDIASSHAEDDPNIIVATYDTDQKTGPRGWIGILRDDDSGAQFLGRCENSTVRGTDVEISADGRIVYVRKHWSTRPGIACWPAEELANNRENGLTIKTLSKDAAPWAIDPATRLVAEGPNVYAADLSSNVSNVTFPVDKFFADGQFAVGLSGLAKPGAAKTRAVRRSGRIVMVPVPKPTPALCVGSVTSVDSVSRIPLPNGWFREPTAVMTRERRKSLSNRGIRIETTRHRPIFVDEVRQRILLCSGDRVLIKRFDEFDASLKLAVR